MLIIGRNNDICQTLRELTKTRLITLTGEPGIGKTSVAKYIANFVKSRNTEIVKNGVIFMNVINCSSTPMLKHKFVNAFREGLGKAIIKSPDRKDTESLFSEVMSTISEIEVLLIIDDAEDLLRTSKNMLKEFIELLFEASSRIKVLLTSKIELISFLGGINGVKGRVIKLKPLTLMASEKLLAEKSGRVITREEKNKLQQMQPEKMHGAFKSAYQHLFDAILGGHPIAISLAANIFSASSLKFLYETLAKSSLMNTLAQGTIGKSTINTKLRFSLKLTLRLVKDKDVFIFFNLMGYFPGGIVSEGIDDLWSKVKRKSSSSDWMQYYHFLAKASLMNKKKVKVNEVQHEVYMLVPMLKTLAEESRGIPERKKVHRQVTNYFNKILKEILNQNSTTKKVTKKLMNTLWYHEMNIWDCIYRALEIKKHNESINTGTTKLESDQNGQNDNHDEEKTKIEEESGSLNDDDYEMILETCKEISHDKAEKNEDGIISKLIDTFKGSIMPNMPKLKKDLKDADLLKIIGDNSRPQNHIKMMGRKTQKRTKSDTTEDNPLASLKRNIDKNLKKQVNNKVVDLIENSSELNSIDKPKEAVYQKVAHKIYEAQEEHKLYMGETMTTVSIKGKQMKQVGSDAKILILYISNLLLFYKKTDAIKTIDEYGQYFYDKNLCEANLRKLRGLALMDAKSDMKANREAVHEFMKAKVIFEQYNSDHGQAIC